MLTVMKYATPVSSQPTSGAGIVILHITMTPTLATVFVFVVAAPSLRGRMIAIVWIVGQCG